MKTRKMSEDEYRELCGEYAGICLACGAIKFSGVEPDAEDYECEHCDKKKVCGIEQALMLGAIEIA